MTLDKGYEKSARFYDLFDNKNNFFFFFNLLRDFNIVIDIGAGTGRIAIPLAENGINVVCIEQSQAMCLEFRKKIKKHHNLIKKIDLINSEAQYFHFKKKFPAAFLSGCFDHLLDFKERNLSLININHHLQNKGKLIFDVFLGLMKNSELQPAGVVKVDEVEYRRFFKSYLTPQKTLDVTLIFETYSNGKLQEKIIQKSFAAVITHKEVHKLLESAGFIVINEYSDYNYSPYKKGDSLLIIEAEKALDVNLLM